MSSVNLAARIGADRVLEPLGALPQPAERLDSAAPVRSHELEIDVHQLWLDSTSHANLRDRAGGDPALMAGLIEEIVAARGKMHNPQTRSGGVLIGSVAALGDAITTDAEVGDEIVSLASLTLTPLRLDRVVTADPATPLVQVEGTASLPETAPWGPLPSDLPRLVALAAYDVYGAASHTRSLAPQGGSVCVLG